jgi:hypothetical protein
LTYVSARDIIIRVRRYTATAIIPFQTTGQFGSGGFTTAAIRNPDGIVS